MTSVASDNEPKAATAARIYDYFLGGTHNFPADREAAKALISAAPAIAASARTNRAFLRRSVRYLTSVGVRQFLDIGSGIPTAGNVHQVARVVPDSRVVYVDIDPVAVAESLEILEGEEGATALLGDLRQPAAILDHPNVRRLINFDEPVGLLLSAVLHFVSDDDEAYGVVGQLVDRLGPGSYLSLSHGSIREDAPGPGDVQQARGIYSGRTTSSLRLRERAAVERFFAGLELVEPGLVWAPAWRPAPDDPADFPDPADSAVLAAVGYKA